MNLWVIISKPGLWFESRFAATEIDLAVPVQKEQLYTEAEPSVGISIVFWFTTLTPNLNINALKIIFLKKISKVVDIDSFNSCSLSEYIYYLSATIY